MVYSACTAVAYPTLRPTNTVTRVTSTHADIMRRVQSYKQQGPWVINDENMTYFRLLSITVSGVL